MAEREEDEEEGEETEATAGDATKKKKKNKKKKKKAEADVEKDAEKGAEVDSGAGAELAQAASTTKADPISASAGGDEGGDEGVAEGGADGTVSDAKKKRDKKKAAAARKKAAAELEEGGDEGGGEDARTLVYDVNGTAWDTMLRGIKRWGPYPVPEKGGKRQTTPPTIPVLEQFPSGNVPKGEEVEYEGDNRYRTTSAELRELERLHNISYQEVRTAAECHRQVRKHMQSVIKPGILMTDMCEELENLNRKLVQENGLKAGIAFPTGEPRSGPCPTSILSHQSLPTRF